MIRKYPKIQSFKNVCKLAYKQNIITPIEYEGTIKLHGTNASIVYDHDGEIVTCQSRNNNINTNSDNAGFARFVEETSELKNGLFASDNEDSYLVIYGEWCGKGIQKGVAVCGLKRMFVIFDAVTKYKDDRPSLNVFNELSDLSDFSLNKLNGIDVYTINQFKRIHTTIDFTSEKSKQEFSKLAEKETKSVGDECPVAKSFGITGLGEGIVWKPTNVDNDNLYIKTKDPRHTVTKVKTIVPLTEEQFAEQTKREDFINSVVTENRIDQAIDEIGDDIKEMGNIIRWLYNDIITEEKDLLEANDIDGKSMGKLIAAAAKPHILSKLL